MKSLFYFFVILFLLSACASSSSSDLSEVFGDSYTVVVSGASSETCTVIGEEERELATGSPDSLTYQVGSEFMVIVECGELSAAIQVGDEAISLNTSSTSVAENLKNTDLSEHTIQLKAALEEIISEFPDSEIEVLSDSLDNSDIRQRVIFSLMDFYYGYYYFLSGRGNRTQNIIKMLANAGQPVVVQNIGENQTLESCTETDARSVFGSFVTVTDASEIGLEGCLVYHEMDAAIDKNNPNGSPANNIPASFRTIVTENGLIATIITAYDNAGSFKGYTASSLHNFIFNSLEMTAHTEDDQGNITPVSISEDNVITFLNSLKNNISTWSPSDARFHTSYNPSGGIMFDTIHSGGEADANCFNSTGTGVELCPVSEARYDFDGTTLTPNEAGDYILQLEWRNGGFLDTAYVVSYISSRPYRNNLYQRVTINLSDYSIDPNDGESSMYTENQLHNSALDPLINSLGQSTPYSTDFWRSYYDDLEEQDNAYVYPSPEIATRLNVIAKSFVNSDRMNVLQAFFAALFIQRGMIAFPVNSNYPVLNDHNLTISEWETAANTWLSSAGNNYLYISGSGKLRVRNDEVTLNISEDCEYYGGNPVDCDITASNISIDPSSESDENDEYITFNLNENASLTLNVDGNVNTFNPTHIRIYFEGNFAYIIGDSNLKLYFGGNNILEKIRESRNLNRTFSFSAVAEVD